MYSKGWATETGGGISIRLVAENMLYSTHQMNFY